MTTGFDDGDEAQAELVAAQAEVAELRRVLDRWQEQYVSDGFAPDKETAKILAAPTCAQPLLDAVADVIDLLQTISSPATLHCAAKLAPWMRR